MWKNNYVDFIKNLFESDQELEDFLNSINTPLSKSIKILKSRMEINQVKNIFEKFWWKLEQTFSKNLEDIFYVDRKDEKLALWKHFLHLLWFFYIQEVSASIPAHFIDVPKWWMVLDISAAPWWKSVQLCDWLLRRFTPRNDDSQWLWLVWSNDLDYKRIQTLSENLERTWMYNSIVTNYDWMWFGKILPETFDAVLLDAPCSWEWTGFKSDFATKYWKEENICKIASLQEKLLESAFLTLKIWWTLVYSTCTINTIENEENVIKILKKYEWMLELVDVKLEGKSYGINMATNTLTTLTGGVVNGDFKNINFQSSTLNPQLLLRSWPHIQKTGWFFVAKFKKTWWVAIGSKLPNIINTDIIFWEGLQKKIWDYVWSNYWIEVCQNQYLFVQFKDKIYVTSPKFLEIHNLAKFQKIWIPIIKIITDWYILLHNFGIIFWAETKRNFINLTENQVWDYVNYKDIKIDDNLQDIPNGFVILRREGKWVGVGKLMWNVVKNKFIRT